MKVLSCLMKEPLPTLNERNTIRNFIKGLYQRKKKTFFYDIQTSFIIIQQCWISIS